MKRLLGQWSTEEGVDLRIWDWGGLLGFEMTGSGWFIPKPEDLRDILAVIAAHGSNITVPSMDARFAEPTCRVEGCPEPKVRGINVCATHERMWDCGDWPRTSDGWARFLRGDDEFLETDETETIEYDPSDPRYRCG